MQLWHAVNLACTLRSLLECVAVVGYVDAASMLTTVRAASYPVTYPYRYVLCVSSACEPSLRKRKKKVLQCSNKGLSSVNRFLLVPWGQRRDTKVLATCPAHCFWTVTPWTWNPASRVRLIIPASIQPPRNGVNACKSTSLAQKGGRLNAVHGQVATRSADSLGRSEKRQS